MSNLPYNPNAGNGITDVNELYTYMIKYPLCVFDRNFMESYGRILCRDPLMTNEYFTEAAHAASGDVKEMGFDITDEDIEERAIDFNQYLQKFPEYDKKGCTMDADHNILIHVLGKGGNWSHQYKQS